jgi:radical SAM protein with 4Fe4S-binding SPASM domain
MNTSTRKYFEIDQPWRLNGSAGSFRSNLEDLILDLAEPAGLVISREQARRTICRLVLHQPQFIRLGNHTTVFAQPAMDWGNAFNSGKVYPAHIGACGYALRNLGVLSNGDVTICCGDYEGRTSLGNLGQQTFAEMLASPRVQAIQQGFERMRVVHPHCQRCLGSSQPVKALLKGVASVYLFHLLRFQPGGKTKEVQLQQTPNHVPEDIGPEMHAGRGQVARALEKISSHQR